MPHSEPIDMTWDFKAHSAARRVTWTSPEVCLGGNLWRRKAEVPHGTQKRL